VGEQLRGWLSPALSLDDAEIMRQTRNTCREFMTRDTHEISYDEQRLWFSTLDRQTILPYVYWIEVEVKAPIGYGLVRLIDESWWISGGLIPRARGQGWGKRLFQGLADIVTIGKQATCWLDVRASNYPARRTYESIGFSTERIDVEGLATTIVMKRSP
jgi:ribosomal protein S18 acetylase RimI-like enzyme